jgi:hypothetical protein
MLSSLQMGFRTLALEKRSSEVWQVLGAVKTEFSKFGDVLAKTKKKLDEASKTIDEAQTRTNVMTRKLKSVESLSEPNTRALLPLADVETEPEVDFGTPLAKEIRAIALDYDMPVASANVVCAAYAKLTASEASASLSFPAQTQRSIAIQECSLTGRHLRVQANNTVDFRLYSARAYLRVLGEFYDGGYEQFDRHFDFGTSDAKQIRGLMIEVDTDGASVTAQLYSDLPGNTLAQRATETFPDTGSGRQVLYWDLGGEIEGKNFRLLISGASTFRLFEIRCDVRVVGTFLAGQDLTEGRAWRSDPLDMGTRAVKEFRKIRMELDADGSLSAILLTDLPGNAMAQRSTFAISASTGRRNVNWQLPDGVIGRLADVRITGTGASNALRLFDMEVEWRPIGGYLEGDEAQWEIEHVDFGSERVKLFREIEIDADTDALATLQIHTEVPGSAMALRSTKTFNTETTTVGRVPVKLTLPQACVGRTLSLFLTCAGTMRLYGVRAFVKPIGEAGNSSWRWVDLPVAATPETYRWSKVPLKGTPSQFGWQTIPLRATSEIFEWRDLPLAR